MTDREKIEYLKARLAEMINYAEEVWDEGPYDEGWKSEELKTKIRLASEALRLEASEDISRQECQPYPASFSFGQSGSTEPKG